MLPADALADYAAMWWCVRVFTGAEMVCWRNGQGSSRGTVVLKSHNGQGDRHAAKICGKWSAHPPAIRGLKQDGPWITTAAAVLHWNVEITALATDAQTVGGLWGTALETVATVRLLLLKPLAGNLLPIMLFGVWDGGDQHWLNRRTEVNGKNHPGADRPKTQHRPGGGGVSAEDTPELANTNHHAAPGASRLGRPTKGGDPNR